MDQAKPVIQAVGIDQRGQDGQDQHSQIRQELPPRQTFAQGIEHYQPQPRQEAAVQVAPEDLQGYQPGQPPEAVRQPGPLQEKQRQGKEGVGEALRPDRAEAEGIQGADQPEDQHRGRDAGPLEAGGPVKKK